MKKTKFMSALAITSMISTMTAVPIFAAETASGGTEVTYTANSASPDQADWLVSYPKKVVVSDFNTSATSGSSLDFKLLDKLTSADYTGNRTVTVSVEDYTTGFTMTGGTNGTATLAIANSTKADLTAASKSVGEMKKKTGSGTENATTGYAYLKNISNPEGTFTKNVTFTFTDDAS